MSSSVKTLWAWLQNACTSSSLEPPAAEDPDALEVADDDEPLPDADEVLADDSAESSPPHAVSRTRAAAAETPEARTGGRRMRPR